MELSAGTYRFGADQGVMRIRTSRTGLGRRAGHDLLIEAERWSGSARIGDGYEVEAEIDVTSLAVREGTGGIKPLTDHDRKEIATTIRGAKLLDAARHPAITFRSSGVRGDADGFDLDGELTIAGTPRPVTVHGVLGADGHVRGSATVTQTKWGIKPYTAFLGALKLADDVTIDFDTALLPT
ncbi:YceI family protein [Actinocatenispora rupis]|nr:YceI family protein [Actinocatenispora rupis]